MISILIGTVAGQERDTGRTPGAVVVNCGGVGYAVVMGARDLKHVTANKPVTIFTRQVWREEKMPLLLGWFHEGARALFDVLLTINGIGPLTAANIAGIYDLDEIRAATAADIAKRVDGVGKTLAARVVEAVKA